MSLSRATDSFENPLESGVVVVGGWRARYKPPSCCFKLRIVFLLLMAATAVRFWRRRLAWLARHGPLTWLTGGMAAAELRRSTSTGSATGTASWAAHASGRWSTATLPIPAGCRG